jgi:hypothetical protein
MIAAKGTAMRIVVALALASTLPGCLAQTALDVATLPVKVASKTLDAVTVSQAEADQKRGREIREREECMGKEARRAEKKDREPDYSRCAVELE